jgi:hypothetical protein
MTVDWNHQLEKVISENGERCLSYEWLHNRAYKKFNRLSVYINLPVIILSTLAGALSVGSNSLFGDFPQAQYIIGAISILVGILNTLLTYFAWESRAEAHRISMIQYAKTYQFVKIELALPRDQRTKPEDFLKMIRDANERLKEISPIIPDDIINQYKLTFKTYTSVSKPEICNGLDNIEIYSPAVEIKINSVRNSLDLTGVKFDIPPIDELKYEDIETTLKGPLPSLAKIIPEKKTPFK